jgi:hypothetical protein
MAAAEFGRGRSAPGVLRSLRLAILPLGVIALAFAIRWSVVGGLGGSAGQASPLLIDIDRYRQTLGALTRDLAWAFAWVAPSTRELWSTLGGVVVVGAFVSVPLLPRPQAAAAMAGVVWVLGFGLFCAVFRVATISWLAYFPLVGVALIIAAVVDGSTTLLRGASMHWFRRSVAGALAVTISAFCVASLAASPLVREYDQWAIAGEVTRIYTSELAACVASNPRATQVQLVQVPGDFDDGRFENGMLGVTLLEHYTVESALGLAFPDRQFGVTIASWETLRGPAKTLRFNCTAVDERVQLTTIYSGA